MLRKLYDYGSEVAKEELFDDYELDGAEEKYREMLRSGLELHEIVIMHALGGDMEDYLEDVENGMRPDDAFTLSLGLADLEPIEGEERVSNVQEWRYCVDAFKDEGYQLAMLAGRMTPTQLEKCQTAYDLGVTPNDFVKYFEIRETYDADGNGSYSGAEVKAALDSMRGLSDKEKAVLWQLATGSKSTKNNPYDKQW